MYPPAIRIDRLCKALEEAAANTVLISPAVGTIQAMNYKEKGNTLKVDLAPSVTNPDDYDDGLLLPGGVANPDELRTNAKAVSFVKRFFDGGKPVAAICHGPWMLVEADVVRGLTLTSWPSLKTDIRKRPTFAMPPAFGWTAGVVRDGQLITSRKPHDIPVFVREMVGEFGERPKIRLTYELTRRCCAKLCVHR